jgi:hypothetical protein
MNLKGIMLYRRSHSKAYIKNVIFSFTKSENRRAEIVLVGELGRRKGFEPLERGTMWGKGVGW